MLGMDPRQFREYVETGLLPRGVRRGKKMVWSREDVEAMHWLEAHRQRLRASRAPSKPKDIPTNRAT